MYRVNSFITTDKEVASTQKRLSICLRSDGFSFSVVFNPLSAAACVEGVGEVWMTYADVDMSLQGSMTEVSSAMQAVFSDLHVAMYGYREAELILPVEHFVWIPSHLYDAALDSRYLSLVARPPVGQSVFSVRNAALDAQLVFAADMSLVSAFQIAFPGIVLRPAVCKFANETLLRQSASHPVMVLFHAQGESLFSVFNKGQLVLSTQRATPTSHDALYAALEIVKAFALDNDSLELLLCGDVDRAFYASLRGFFPVITLYCGPQRSCFNSAFQHFQSYRMPF